MKIKNGLYRSRTSRAQVDLLFVEGWDQGRSAIGCLRLLHLITVCRFRWLAVRAGRPEGDGLILVADSRRNGADTYTSVYPQVAVEATETAAKIVPRRAVADPDASTPLAHTPSSESAGADNHWSSGGPNVSA